MTWTGIRPGTVRNLLTGFICVLGTCAIVWGLLVLPLFRQEASSRSITAKLFGGESYPLKVLLDQAQQAETAAQRLPYCMPTALQSIFVLRLFALSKAIAESNKIDIESSYTPLVDATRSALSCTPADSFAWLTLFWLDAGKYGLNGKNVDYLRLSYSFGPNEGWIALWRIRLAFLLFDRLPNDLSKHAVDDFTHLVNTGWFYLQTADVFKSASPAAQTRIVEQLKTVNLVNRITFARVLREKNVDVDIPDVDKPTRPWQ